jgi:hypothetical protein
MFVVGCKNRSLLSLSYVTLIGIVRC